MCCFGDGDRTGWVGGVGSGDAGGGAGVVDVGMIA